MGGGGGSGDDCGEKLNKHDSSVACEGPTDAGSKETPQTVNVIYTSATAVRRELLFPFECWTPYLLLTLASATSFISPLKESASPILLPHGALT